MGMRKDDESMSPRCSWVVVSAGADVSSAAAEGGVLSGSVHAKEGHAAARCWEGLLEGGGFGGSQREEGLSKGFLEGVLTPYWRVQLLMRVALSASTFRPSPHCATS